MWSRKTLKNELQKLDKKPSGARGQHFMTDSGYLSYIVDQAGAEPGDVVLEIGTGPGHLTTTLLESGCYVVGVEIDETLADLCRKQTGDPEELSLFVNDVLDEEERVQPDLQVMIRNTLKRAATDSIRLVSNLPYRRGTNILISLLESPMSFDRENFIVLQEALAEKLMAMPGTSDFGIPSVLFQWRGQMEVLETVPRQVFWPEPEVESVLCRVIQDSEWVDIDASFDRYERMKSVVRTLFMHPRKTLRNNIKLSDDYSIEDVDMYGSFVDLFLDKRPEQLTPKEWYDLVGSLLSSEDRNEVDVQEPLDEGEGPA